MHNILEAYTHFQLQYQPTPLGKGNINDTYLVHSRRGKKYVLQRINQEVFKKPEQLIENHLFVQDFLKKNGYPLQIPRLLPNDWGAFFTKNTDGSFWRLLHFCEADFPQTAFFTKNKKQSEKPYQSAYTFGLFDAFLKKMPKGKLHETIPNFHHTPLRWAVFEKALQDDCLHRTAGVLPEIKALFAWKPTFERIFALIKTGELPTQLIHNDAKLDNILFDYSGKTPIAVIDWDTLMPGCIFADIGDLVRTFAPNVDENHPSTAEIEVDKNAIEGIFAGFQDGYAQCGTDLKCAEHLPLAAPWIVGEQALRFLTDYLQGDVYYKTEYAGQNLVRARNQLRVLELLY